MKKREQNRTNYDRSAAWLRRARMKYAAICRPWVERVRKREAYLGRVRVVADRMRESGLLKTKCHHDALWSLMSQWRRTDGMNWWRWRHADKRREWLFDRLPADEYAAMAAKELRRIA